MDTFWVHVGPCWTEFRSNEAASAPPWNPSNPRESSRLGEGFKFTRIEGGVLIGLYGVFLLLLELQRQGYITL